ncbi:electron transport complex protein RnfG [Edwardsiella tarda]|nr:electron transport complex protein RnfG [Edwardsiella tarda]
MLTTMRRHGIRLALFAVLATALTAVVHQLTSRTIAQQAARQQQQLFDQVIAPADYDNDLQGSCRLIRDARLGDDQPHRLYLAQRQGQPVAALVEATAPTVTLAPFVSWSVPILPVRSSEYASSSSMKHQDSAIRSNAASPIGSTASAIKWYMAPPI